MTSSAPPLAPPPAPPLEPPLEPRRAGRDLERGLVGGVAAGLADHLGLPVLGLRIGFVVATVLGGLGAVLYGAYWLFLPAAPLGGQPDAAPGLAGATRDGRRPRGLLGRPAGRTGDAIVVGVLSIGLVLAVEAVVGRGALVWALALVAGGVALLWRQSDEVQRERWIERTERMDPVGMVLGSGGWAAWTRIALGAVLLASGLVLLGFRDGGIGAAREVVLAVLLGIGGLAVVVGPWVARLVRDLGAERSERIRSQERADVAAHLHDSVLQTLALIQKNAGDAATVARLARAQERDLRAWLFAEERPGSPGAGTGAAPETLAAAVRAVAAAVEDDHGIEVEVVAVGDTPWAERVQPVVAAVREAVVNAAKHAGTGRVDVYVEVLGGAVDVFVRDRGAGFDPDDLPLDRHGVRGSIVDRMVRHGGTARIRSAPGEGTEVRVHLPASSEQAQQVDQAQAGVGGTDAAGRGAQ